MTSPCVEAAVRELKLAGIEPEVFNAGKHVAIRWHANGSPRTCHVSGTPSDWRAPAKARSDIRRMLREDGVGADVDEPARAAPDSPRVFLKDGKFFCDSRDIAKHFGKMHKDVLRSIDKLLPDMGDFTERNFTPSQYTDPTGRKLRCFNLTRDGFTILAMGFTGQSALEWKVKYIDAFNAMERELSFIANDDSALAERVSKIEGDLTTLIDLCFAMPQPEPGYTIVRAHKRRNPKHRSTPPAPTQVDAAAGQLLLA